MLNGHLETGRVKRWWRGYQRGIFGVKIRALQHVAMGDVVLFNEDPLMGDL